MIKPAKSPKSIPISTGELCKKGSKVYLKVEERLYSVHLWDIEKHNPKGKEKATGVLFTFKDPVVDHQVYVHGWVYPGTLEILESEVKPSKSKKKQQKQIDREENNDAQT
jgi:hypothetical protein